MNSMQPLPPGAKGCKERVWAARDRPRPSSFGTRPELASGHGDRRWGHAEKMPESANQFRDLREVMPHSKPTGPRAHAVPERPARHEMDSRSRSQPPPQTVRWGSPTSLVIPASPPARSNRAAIPMMVLGAPENDQIARRLRPLDPSPSPRTQPWSGNSAGSPLRSPGGLVVLAAGHREYSGKISCHHRMPSPYDGLGRVSKATRAAHDVREAAGASRPSSSRHVLYWAISQ